MNLASFGGPALALRTRVTKRVDAMTPRQRKVSRALSMFSLVALTSLLSAEPAFAQTNLESFGNAVLGLLSNGLLRIVAILALISACFLFLLPLLRFACLLINALANQLKKVGSLLPRLFCCPRASMTTNRDSLARMSPPTHSVLQKIGADTRMGDHRSEPFERFVPEMVALPLSREGDCLHRPLCHSSGSHAAVTGTRAPWSARSATARQADQGSARCADEGERERGGKA